MRQMRQLGLAQMRRMAATIGVVAALLLAGCSSWTYGALHSGDASRPELSGVYSLGPFFVSAIAINETKYWYDDRDLAGEVEAVLHVLDPRAFPADGSGTKVWTKVFEDKPRGKFPGAKESCKVCAGPGADPMDWESVKAVIGAIGEKPSQAVERVLAERAGGYVVNGKAVWCETVARCILIDLARCEGRKK